MRLRTMRLLQVLWWFTLLGKVIGDEFIYKGCYSKEDAESILSQDLQTDIFQSLGLCKGQCSGSALYGLTMKSGCACGTDAKALNKLKPLPVSKCMESCSGYPSDKCGSMDAYSIYVNIKNMREVKGKFEKDPSDPDYTSSAESSSTSTSLSSSSSSSTPSSSSSTLSSSAASSPSSSLSSSSASSSSASSSSATNSSTPSSASSASSASSSSNSMTSSSSSSSVSSSSSLLITPLPGTSSDSNTLTATSFSDNGPTPSPRIVTTERSDGSVITVTVVPSTSTVTNAASLDGSKNLVGNTGKNSSNKSLSGGAIAGIVLGVFTGLLLIVLLVLLMLWNRNKDNDESIHNDIEEKRFHQPYSLGEQDPLSHLTTSSNASRYQPRSGSDNSMLSQGHGIFADQVPSAHYQGADYGVPRLSNSSLPDVTASRPLRIANPDSD